jgi:hypothetical protein
MIRERNVRWWGRAPWKAAWGDWRCAVKRSIEARALLGYRNILESYDNGTQGRRTYINNVYH